MTTYNGGFSAEGEKLNVEMCQHEDAFPALGAIGGGRIALSTH